MCLLEFVSHVLRLRCFMKSDLPSCKRCNGKSMELLCHESVSSIENREGGSYGYRLRMEAVQWEIARWRGPRCDGFATFVRPDMAVVGQHWRIWITIGLSRPRWEGKKHYFRLDNQTLFSKKIVTNCFQSVSKTKRFGNKNCTSDVSKPRSRGWNLFFGQSRTFFMFEATMAASVW